MPGRQFWIGVLVAALGAGALSALFRPDTSPHAVARAEGAHDATEPAGEPKATREPKTAGEPKPTAKAVEQVFDKWARFGSGVTEFVDKTKWIALVVVVIIVLRTRLGELIDELIKRIGEGGLQFKASQIEFSISERVADTMSPPQLSPTPFEEPLQRAPTDLEMLAPQISFSVTDISAQAWVKRSGSKSLVEAATAARKKLEAACVQPKADATTIRPCLDDYATALELSRFAGAKEFCAVLDGQAQGALGPLITELEQNKTPSLPADIRILHAIGAARAYARRWESAAAVLEPLVVKAGYLPAADLLICCKFNRFVCQYDPLSSGSSPPDPEAALGEFVAEFQQLAGLLETKIPAAQWANFPIAAGNGAYYERELLCAFGLVQSILGDLDTANRLKWLKGARDRLAQCANPRSAEPPTARDFNNFADVLRQLDECDAALEWVERIRKTNEPWLPSYAGTYAKILHSQKKHPESLLALREYSEADAANLQDEAEFELYIDNEILHAKLLFTYLAQQELADVTPVIDILQRARDLLERKKSILAPAIALTLRRRSTEALAFAYLEIPHKVKLAAAEFGRLRDTGYKDICGLARHGVALAHGYVRLARAERRDLSRARAREALEDGWRALAEARTQLDAEAANAGPLLRGGFLLVRVDAMSAALEMAEEFLQQEELKRAGEAITDSRALRLSVEDRLANSATSTALGDKLADVRRQLNQAEAREHFGDGRIAGRGSVKLTGEIIDTVRNHFGPPRGFGPPLRDRVDLEWGRFLLEAALKGEGDVVTWHEEALDALERVLGTSEIELRREAVRLHGVAVAQTQTVRARDRRLRARAS